MFSRYGLHRCVSVLVCRLRFGSDADGLEAQTLMNDLPRSMKVAAAACSIEHLAIGTAKNKTQARSIHCEKKTLP